MPSSSSSFVSTPAPEARLQPTSEKNGSESPNANLEDSGKVKKASSFAPRKSHFLVASALKADETGLVTLERTLSMNNRRENRVKLLLFLTSLARFTLKNTLRLCLMPIFSYLTQQSLPPYRLNVGLRVQLVLYSMNSFVLIPENRFCMFEEHSMKQSIRHLYPINVCAV
jgi:hypothetical protein